jgi:hypothetical protein
MAELTTLEEKLAEVLGLAQAAQGAADAADVKDGSLKLAGEKDPYEES